MNESELTPLQQAMVAAWDRHTAAEFVDSDVDATLATMTDNPYVYNVAVMAGGFGINNVRAFYSGLFLPGNPADTEGKLVARTVGANRIVPTQRPARPDDSTDDVSIARFPVGVQRGPRFGRK